MELLEEKTKLAMEIAAMELHEDQIKAIRKIMAGKQAPKKLLTPNDVCAMLAITRPTLSKYVREGLLTPVQYSKSKVRYEEQQVVNFFNNGR